MNNNTDYDTDLDYTDFKDSVDNLSREDLLWHLANLDLIVKKIRFQIEFPLPHSTQEWKTNAQNALWYRMKDRELIKQRLGEIKKEKATFQQVAKEHLSAEWYNYLVSKAQEALKNA